MNDLLSTIDIVTVFHNKKNKQQAEELKFILGLHSDVTYNIVLVDNIKDNKGFAPACNEGAKKGTAPVVGFLNPDIKINGYLGHYIRNVFIDPNLVITGSKFNKPPGEYRSSWGCYDWVCGACLFVLRDWFESVGGFDERYIWGWEESDLIRLAQSQGKKVKSIELPVEHSSPEDDSPEDAKYKNLHFNKGAQLFRSKWK